MVHESPDEVLRRVEAAYRDPELVVLEGFHAVKHAIVFGGAPTDLVTDDRASLDPLLEAVRGVDRHVVDVVAAQTSVCAAGALRSVVRRDLASPLLGVARCRRTDPAAMLGDRGGFLVVLDEPRHSGNAGAVVRVAAAAGAHGVLMVGDLDAWSAPVVRAAAGLHWALDVASSADRAMLCDPNRRDGRMLVAFDPQGEPFDPAAVPADAVLAFGSERYGLGADVRAAADRCVSLPMRAGVSSLNLATSVAAVLYVLRLRTPGV